MLDQLIKVLLTSVLVVTASEAAKRSVVLGALIASLPLTSILAMIWLYADTRDPQRLAAFATGIFWLVLPSLVMLIVLPCCCAKASRSRRALPSRWRRPRPAIWSCSGS